MISEKDNGTFTAVQKKINNTQDGGTITLENDYAYDEGFDTNGLKLSKSLTIDGQGHTLNGLSKSRIIFVDGTYSIVLKNIQFKNGYHSSQGGAINIDSGYSLANYPYFKIINCEFTNNVADDGGAIYSDISHVIIQNSIFNNNVAYNCGGSIFLHCGSLVQKDWNIYNSTFNNNRAQNGGGAICSYCENLYVEGCKFNDNNADDGEGGAIKVLTTTQHLAGGEYDGGKNSKIVKCEFNNNKARYGGAIHLDAKYCTLNSSTFYDGVYNDFIVVWKSVGGVINNCTSITTNKERLYNLAAGNDVKVTGWNYIVIDPPASDSQSSSSNSSSGS